MSILKKLKLSGSETPDIRTFCMQDMRFKKFLGNARVLLDLFEDGREKSMGEYIFDRHYVVTLIESIVERLGMVIYDACVLVPEKGEMLYRQYDHYVLFARNLILRDALPAGEMAGEQEPFDGPVLEEPEYQLLADVLKWATKDDAEGGLSVMGFMRQAFYHVIQEMESIEGLKRSGIFSNSSGNGTHGLIYLVDLWMDASGFLSSEWSSGDIRSIPLKHLLSDASLNAASPGQENGNPMTWIAAVGEYQLSLTSFSSDVNFRLETTVSGYEQSDFIFIFADDIINLENILPGGFHVEHTDFGYLAWNLGASTKVIAESLRIIGRGLFNEHLRQSR
jgi:hypothetical protein